MNNRSAHCSIESLPELQRVKVKFLPSNTTSRLQLLNAGIIAAIKVRYRRHQMEYAVDLADFGAKELYKAEILTAMRWLLKVWKEVTPEVISNC